MKLPEMKKGATMGFKPFNARSRTFTVRWTITDGIQKETF